MPHRILCPPLRDYHHASPGPVEIRYGRGHVAILAGGKLVALQGGASGTWPSSVVIDDPAVLDRLRYPREVRKIQISYMDGVLDVQVAEYARPTRQPWLPFGDIPARPSAPEVALPAPRVTGQLALEF